MESKQPNIEPISDYAPWVPPEDASKVADAHKETYKLASSSAVIQDVMDWLEMKRSQYRGIDIISGVNPGSDAEDIKSAVLLNQAMGSELDLLLKNFRVEFAKFIEEVPIEQQ